MNASSSRSRQFGLLFATMEPPTSLEEEFQEWYDEEHFPQRRQTTGFRTATRLVCLDGWPRFLALYDLDDLSVLSGTGYGGFTGENTSRWTSRIVNGVYGHYRVGARQIYPGDAVIGDQGRFSRLVVWRFRDTPRSLGSHIVQGIRALYEPHPETAQVRVFETEGETSTDYLAIAEQHLPWSLPDGAAATLGEIRRYVDLVNVYTEYRRRW